jgi:hypothetical protein
VALLYTLPPSDLPTKGTFTTRRGNTVQVRDVGDRTVVTDRHGRFLCSRANPVDAAATAWRSF